MARTILGVIRAAPICRAPTEAVPTVVSGRRTVATILRIELDRKIAVRSRRPPADIGDRTLGIRPTAGRATASAQRLTAPSQIDLAGTPTVRPAVGHREKVNDPEEIGRIGTGHRTTDSATT